MLPNLGVTNRYHLGTGASTATEGIELLLAQPTFRVSTMMLSPKGTPERIHVLKQVRKAPRRLH